MPFNALFDALDLNNDGELSRSELHDAAQSLGWYWQEAPVLAVFDLLTIDNPISKKTFTDYMTRILEDPLGPYGKVLLNSRYFSSAAAGEKNDLGSNHNRWKTHAIGKSRQALKLKPKTYHDRVSLLEHIAGAEVARKYRNLLKNLNNPQPQISVDDAALLIIDPQHSFTNGTWMRSIGLQAEFEVKPIRSAFENCALFLHENYHRIETMFTRCPFPPGSYDWDESINGLIDDTQFYFIKPGNSVLFPPTNGFRNWVEYLIKQGKKILVMGGCTLNSCIRVSSIETQKYFKGHQLQVIVDLNLSGARTSNFISTSMFDGLSAVEAAVREMIDAGVCVVQSIKWQ
ncbi:MAG: hypothetical protein JW786_01195 [Desulfobacterales bacterium]|nr:hypothetical protein [Desulfobacterales bacterium]